MVQVVSLLLNCLPGNFYRINDTGNRFFLDFQLTATVFLLYHKGKFAYKNQHNQMNGTDTLFFIVFFFCFILWFF